MNSDADVIIVGGGIAGLATAIALRRRGVEPTVLERSPELGEIGAGLLLAPNACAVLERLGALALLLDGRSVPVDRWELQDWRGKLLSSLAIPRAGEQSISTRRSDLQHALLQRLPAESVQLGCHVTGAEIAANGVQVVLEDGRRISARHLVLADGAHSLARESLWPGREPRYRGYIGWRGIVDFVPEGWEGGRVSESWGLGRRFGMATLGGGKTYWYASANAPVERCQERVALAQLKRDFAEWHRPVAEILAAMPEEALLQHPILDRRPPWHWQIEEKAVMVGDAAHPLTPNLGQGASMALEDAWELAVHWGSPKQMERFERQRRLRLFGLWGISRSLGAMIQWESSLLCRIRDVGVRSTPDALASSVLRRILHFQPGEIGK